MKLQLSCKCSVVARPSFHLPQCSTGSWHLKPAFTFAPSALCWLVQDVRGDIFAFGLCMLELLTLKQLDPQHCLEVPQLLQQVSG
jgi:hypothetical protein